MGEKPVHAANDVPGGTLARRPRFPLLPAAAALLAVAGMAFLHVPYPFDDDQGLFTYGARALAHGARLYVDFWDLKQPGIYWYYALAGSLFGFDETGIHAFDLLWMLALAIVSYRIAQVCVSRPWLAAQTPIICLGPFYAKAEPIHLAQVESVVLLPLAAIVGLLLPAEPAPRHAWRFAAAGAIGVGVAAFKFMLAPIAAALVLVACLHAWMIGGSSPRAVLRYALSPALGAALAATLLLLACLGYAGILEPTLWVAFVYPHEVLAEYDWQPLRTLLESAAWFWSAERFVVPFALIGAWREVVQRRSRLGWLALAWLAVAAAVVLAQVLSWWPYHFNLFFVPLGLLGACGVDALGDVARRLRLRWVSAAAAALIALTIAVPLQHKLQRYWLAGPSPFVDPMGFMIRVEPRMQTVADGAAFLARADAKAGTIANLGDPRLFLYAGRPAVLAVNGSGYMLGAQWREAAQRLRRESPAYIYLGNDTRYVWTHGDDAIGRLVEERYVLRWRDRRGGEWQELRDAGAAATGQAGR